jgi:pSer/pThr/pTyr-binding forkhead associated (FHA) protein
MPTLVLDLLKYAFLAVLYIFIARAVKAAYMELRPPSAPRPGRRSAAPAPARPPPKRSKKPARRIAVVEGDSLRGKTFDIGEELTIGRAEKCSVVLDDSYVSQVHARIFANNGGYMVEDLGSTNGTYLNRRRITAPTELQRGDRVKIGKTVLEMRK